MSRGGGEEVFEQGQEGVEKREVRCLSRGGGGVEKREVFEQGGGVEKREMRCLSRGRRG